MPGWSGSAASRRSRSSRVSAAQVSGSSPSGPVVAAARRRRAARRACCCRRWPARWRPRRRSRSPIPPRRPRGRPRPRRRNAAPTPARRRGRPAGPRAVRRRRQQVAGDLQERGLLVVRARAPARRPPPAPGATPAAAPGSDGGAVVLDRDLRRADPAALRPGGGQGRTEVAVQPQPPRRVQLLVDGVPDQRVGEVVAIGDGVRDDEPGLEQLVERGESVGVQPRAALAGSNRNGPSTVAATSSSRLVVPAAGGAGERSPGEPPPAPPRAAAASAAPVGRHRAVLAQVVDHLAGEERVAVGLRADRRHQLRGDRGADARPSAVRRPRGEPGQPQAGALGLAAQRPERVASGCPPVTSSPGRRRPPAAGATGVAGDVPEHRDRAVVGPVQIVDEQHTVASAARREDRATPSSRRSRSSSGCRPGADGTAAAVPRHQLEGVGAGGACPGSRRSPRRTDGTATPRRPPGTARRARARPCRSPRRQLGEQPALADAGLAGHERHPTPTRGGVGEVVEQRRQLAVAAEARHGRGAEPRGAGRRRCPAPHPGRGSPPPAAAPPVPDRPRARRPAPPAAGGTPRAPRPADRPGTARA